ncbi:hypothetical protein B0H13DRAFT_876340 [Mycena leptocephala]|nr:hypothetical protein B0H13DRAFT_876340 [Mycena leptocephala]
MTASQLPATAWLQPSNNPALRIQILPRWSLIAVIDNPACPFTRPSRLQQFQVAMNQDNHSVLDSEPALATQSTTSHMFQNSTDFGIEGSQFVNVQGDMNIHPMIPLVAPGKLVPNAPSPQTTVFSESGNYSSQLLYRSRGFPLYVPGPQINLPENYRRKGVAIGDVGTVTPDGDFDFFFNIYLPADDPINENIPEDFVPLSHYKSVDVHHRHFEPGDYVASRSIQEINGDFSSGDPGGEFVFSCEGPTGAILALPYGSHQVKLRDLATMRRYATKHAESWYRYANETRGRELVNGSLYLVSGWEKTASWGMALFHDISPQNEFELSFRPTTDAEAGYKYRWQGTRFHHKHVDLPPVDGTPPNQTTFIHAFAISLGEGIRGKLFGAVELCPLVDSPPTAGQSGRGFVPFGSQSSLFSWSFSIFRGGDQSEGRQCAENGIISDAAPIPKVFHPSQIIHEHILREVPQARVVITHDDDWRDVFGDDGTVPTSSELQKAIFDRFKIMEDDGVVFLSAKSEPTPLEHKGPSYPPEMDLHNKPSSTETVDLPVPSPAGDELTFDQPTYAYSSSSNNVAGHYGHRRSESGSPVPCYEDYLDYSIPQGSPVISPGLSRIDISSQFSKHDNQLEPTSATSVDISGESAAWSPTQESSRSHNVPWAATANDHNVVDDYVAQPPPNRSMSTAPVGFPYNLPRTTRQQMLRNEMSESLGRNLLWQRKLSRTDVTGPQPRRTKSTMNVPGAGQGGRQAEKSLVRVTLREPGTERRETLPPMDPPVLEGAPKKKLVRNLSWADLSDFHRTGW